MARVSESCPHRSTSAGSGATRSVQLGLATGNWHSLLSTRFRRPRRRPSVGTLCRVARCQAREEGSPISQRTNSNSVSVAFHCSWVHCRSQLARFNFCLHRSRSTRRLAQRTNLLCARCVSLICTRRSSDLHPVSALSPASEDERRWTTIAPHRRLRRGIGM